MPLRRDAQGRLPAHRHEVREGLVADRRCRRRRILRIERHEEDAVAARLGERVDAGPDRGIPVAHGEVDDDPVGQRRERSGELFRLGTGDDEEGRGAGLVIPDRLVLRAALAGARGQDDEVEDRPPDRPRHLDDATVRQEFLEVAPHRPIGRRVGRAEVDEEHADLAGSGDGMVRRQGLRRGSAALQVHGVAPSAEAV